MFYNSIYTKFNYPYIKVVICSVSALLCFHYKRIWTKIVDLWTFCLLDIETLLIKHFFHLKCQWLVAPMENKHNCDTICIWVSLLNDIELHNTIIISLSLLYVAFIKGEKLFLNVMYKDLLLIQKVLGIWTYWPIVTLYKICLPNFNFCKR